MFARNWAPNQRKAFFLRSPTGPSRSAEDTRAAAIPIIAKRNNQTGPKLPSGGVPGGRTREAYQSLDQKVMSPLEFPATSSTTTHRTALFQNTGICGLLSMVIGEQTRFSRGRAPYL